MPTQTTHVEQVKHEYPAIGKYRVRVVQKGNNPPAFDVREYVKADTFEGFTRRGVRLNTREDAVSLMAALQDLLQRGTLK